MSLTTTSSGSSVPLAQLLFLLAVALPPLVAFEQGPSTTFYNQVVAVGGWALACVWMSRQKCNVAATGDPRGVGALLLVLLILLVCVRLAVFTINLPWGIALRNLGVLTTAAGVLMAGWHVGRSNRATEYFTCFCQALLVAGLLSCLVGLVQFFAPALAGNLLVAGTGLEGRAAGNLRQPNHLGTLLLLSTAAAVWLANNRQLARRPVAAYVVLSLLVVVLSGSRTAMLTVAVLVLWAALDRSLAPSLRKVLMFAPLMLVGGWLLAAAWGMLDGHAYIGQVRLQQSGDLSSKRLAIWADTLRLIAEHPLLGVGVGGFNFAWTLTPNAHRPSAYFDHSHNLSLQMLVELGVPLGGAVCLGLGYAVWRAARQAWRAEAATSPHRAVLAMLSVVGLHSMLELPLWYAHFLLPVMFAFGLSSGASRVGDAKPATSAAALRSGVTAVGAAALAASLFAVVDYQRVVPVFKPRPGDAPFAERVEQGRRSVLFGHYVDFVALVVSEPRAAALQWAGPASMTLLDGRLLQAWSLALAAQGDLPRATFLAQRLREFNRPESTEFFAPCSAAAPSAQPLPYQCAAAPVQMAPPDFR